MAHLVTYRIAGSAVAELHTRMCADLDDALRELEHLRNEEQTEDVRLYDATEIPIEFKTWYRVEIGDAAPVPHAAPVEAEAVPAREDVIDADTDADADVAHTAQVEADTEVDDDAAEIEAAYAAQADVDAFAALHEVAAAEVVDYESMREAVPYDAASIDAMRERAYDAHRAHVAAMPEVTPMPETNFGIFSRP